MEKNNNGITLLALVITIIIMLLLAGLAIQLTFGENGLIVKSIQSHKEQAKAELVETSKLEYANLKSKNLETQTDEASFSSLLSTPNFLNKYNIVGDNITSKNSNYVIMSKKELKDSLNLGDSSTEITDEDKYSTVLKLRVPNGSEEERTFGIVSESGSHYPIGYDLDFGNGQKVKEEYLSSGITHKQIYDPGEYIVKLKIHDYTYRT